MRTSWIIKDDRDTVPMDRRPVLAVIAAATLYGVGLPLTKALLKDIPPVAMAGLLYCGAFFGLGLYYVLAGLARKKPKDASFNLSRRDMPWLAGSVVTGGFLAPILLMAGLNMATGFSASRASGSD